MKRGLATLALFVVVAVGYTVARGNFIQTTTTTTAPVSNFCSADQLTTKWIDGTGAAGTLYAWVKVTNSSNATCVIPSQPSISFFDAAGGSLPADLIQQSTDGQLLDWSDNPISTTGSSSVTLEAGSSVALALSFVNDASCSTVSLMRLSWTNGSVAVAPHYLVSQCNGPSGLRSRLYLAS